MKPKGLPNLLLSLEEDRFRTALFCFLLSAVAVGVGSTFLFGDEFSYPIWADRALVRSFGIFENFQFGGAELNTGGQTPGSFYYLFLRGLLSFTDSPLTIHRVMLVLFAFSVAAAFFLARTFAGNLASLCGASLMVGARPIQSNLGELTNPAFTFLLAVAIWWLMVEIARNRRGELLPVFTVLMLLTAQIHMSYYLLVPPLIAVMILYRIAARPRDWLLSLAAVVLLLGPYFLNELLSRTSNFQDMVSVYQAHLIPIERRFSELLTTFLFANLGFHTSAIGKIFSSSPARMAAMIGATSVFILLVLYWLFHRIRDAGKTPRDAGISRVLTLIYLSVALMLIVSFAAGVTFKPRRMLYLQPGFVLLVALAAEFVLNRMARTGSWQKPLSGAFVGLVVVTTIWNSAWWHYRWPYDFPRFKDLSEIISLGRQEFDFNKADFRQGVLILTPRKNEWVPEFSNQNTAFDFLTKDLPRGEPQRQCLAVFSSMQGGEISDEQAVRTLKSSFDKDLGPLTVGKAVRTERFLIQSFSTAGGNCPRTVNNRYIPTPAEKEIAAIVLAGRGEVKALPPREREEMARLVFQLGEKVPLRLLAVLRRGPQGYSVELHSRDLRGYDGIAKFGLKNARLLFSNRENSGNQIAESALYPGWLGSWSTAITPWRSAAVPLRSGRYEVRLRADLLRTPLSEEGPIDVTLIGGLEIGQ